MKFMVDASAGKRLSDWLASQGHDTLFAPDLGPDPGDAALMAQAEASGRTVVTLDRNFGKAAVVANAKAPAIIFLPSVRHDLRLELLQKVLAGFTSQINQGHWIIATRGKIRVRPVDGKR
jgi:predicted nuclease of predicted toxin-antitoxin system